MKTQIALFHLSKKALLLFLFLFTFQIADAQEVEARLPEAHISSGWKIPDTLSCIYAWYASSSDKYYFGYFSAERGSSGWYERGCTHCDAGPPKHPNHWWDYNPDDDGMGVWFELEDDESNPKTKYYLGDTIPGHDGSQPIRGGIVFNIAGSDWLRVNTGAYSLSGTPSRMYDIRRFFNDGIGPEALGETNNKVVFKECWNVYEPEGNPYGMFPYNWSSGASTFQSQRSTTSWAQRSAGGCSENNKENVDRFWPCNNRHSTAALGGCD